MLKVATLASVLIQYTLYNRLIVWVLFFFIFILKSIQIQAGYKSKKQRKQKCNWYIFFTQQFVK